MGAGRDGLWDHRGGSDHASVKMRVRVRVAARRGGLPGALVPCQLSDTDGCVQGNSLKGAFYSRSLSRAWQPLPSRHPGGPARLGRAPQGPGIPPCFQAAHTLPTHLLSLES